jgi:GNAT superfamily N-acetyltransferase
MKIHKAITDKEIASCFYIMRELRPHITKQEFITRVRRQEEAGYRLAFLALDDKPIAVAGFRIGECLAWGRFLYIDDLVTAETQRSMGFGEKLLAWLREYAVAENCQQLHLDSGIQRQEAHRFYEREGLSKSAFHFVETL